MRQLFAVVVVLLAVLCIAESFSLKAKSKMFDRTLQENILKSNKVTSARAKRSLNPFMKSPAQNNALFHAAKAAERVRQQRSTADVSKKMHLGDVNIDSSAVNAAMEKIKALQKRAAAISGFNFNRFKFNDRR